MMTSSDASIDALAQDVLVLAKERGVTIGCAESCTGGLIAAALTEVPGSSDSFVGGVVSYWVEVKESVLGVPHDVIEMHGVVSEQTAHAMAKGACAALGCDFAVATTGIAGPTGALPGKPVGTVCFGIEGPGVRRSFTTCKGTSRREVRKLAVATALQALFDALNESSSSRES